MVTNSINGKTLYIFIDVFLFFFSTLVELESENVCLCVLKGAAWIGVETSKKFGIWLK